MRMHVTVYGCIQATYMAGMYRILISRRHFTTTTATPFALENSTQISGVTAMTSVFRFPLDAPALTGTLLKQGEFGLHLSKKFLILYPGFLVFYDNSDRWTLDVKCGTLSVSLVESVLFNRVVMVLRRHTGQIRSCLLEEIQDWGDGSREHKVSLRILCRRSRCPKQEKVSWQPCR